jgi:hypothetical protein
MNERRLIVVLSILLAFAAGVFLGLRGTLAWTSRVALKRLADSEFYAATLSVAGLERLEKGDIDGAKRVLATDLSAYVKSKAKEVPSSHEAVLLQQIQKTSEHSPMLKEMLAKPSQ